MISLGHTVVDWGWGLSWRRFLFLARWSSPAARTLIRPAAREQFDQCDERGRGNLRRLNLRRRRRT